MQRAGADGRDPDSPGFTNAHNETDRRPFYLTLIGSGLRLEQYNWWTGKSNRICRKGLFADVNHKVIVN